MIFIGENFFQKEYLKNAKKFKETILLRRFTFDFKLIDDRRKT